MSPMLTILIILRPFEVNSAFSLAKSVSISLWASTVEHTESEDFAAVAAKRSASH